MEGGSYHEDHALEGESSLLSILDRTFIITLPVRSARIVQEVRETVEDASKPAHADAAEALLQIAEDCIRSTMAWMLLRWFLGNQLFFSCCHMSIYLSLIHI